MKVNNIFVAGSGTMGVSIAQIFAQYGFSVTVYDVADAALEKGKLLCAINQQAQIDAGKLTREQSAEICDRIHYTTDITQAAHADFVTESIVERMEIKHSFWGECSRHARKDIVLSTNTSGLSITEIAKAVINPQRFLGMHWFNPPHIIPLIEIIKGEHTQDCYAQAVYQLSQDIGKKPIYVQKDVPGFVANRVQFAVLRELLHLVKDGVVSFEDGDNVMKHGLGIRYAAFGPFEIADLGGLDTFSNISNYLFADLDASAQGSDLFRDLVAQGRLGVKSGAGIYDYSDGRADEVVSRRDEMFMKLCDCLYGEK